jgi:hypothetical protein
MLVIEVDGLTHLFEETQRKDARKEQYLKNLGYTVFRVKDEDVLRSMNQVINAIGETIDGLSSTPAVPAPPPAGDTRRRPLPLLEGVAAGRGRYPPLGGGARRAGEDKDSKGE